MTKDIEMQDQPTGILDDKMIENLITKDLIKQLMNEFMSQKLYDS